MTEKEVELLEQARCAAMIGADVAALDGLLSNELRWAHSSGQIDDKAAMLDQFGSGSLRCFTIERSETDVRIFGTAAIVTGVVQMDAMAGGARKTIHSRYAGVWSDHTGKPALVNWQSAPIR